MIGHKMLAGYLLIAVITAALGCLSTISLKKLLTSEEETYMHSTEPLGSSGRIGILVQRSRVNIRGMLLDDSVKRMQGNAATINKNYAIVDEEIALLEKSLRGDASLQELKKLQAAIVAYKPIREQIVTLAIGEERDEALDLMRGDGLVYEKQIDASVGKLLDLQVEEAKENVDKNTSAALKAIKSNILLVLLGIISAIVLGLYLSRRITGPLRKIVDIASAIADGDLTRRIDIDQKDETGQLATAMNSMTDRLRSIISILSGQSAAVSGSAGKLNEMATQMANGTEEVAMQAGTLSTASEEMAATTSEIAASCTRVAEEAKKASDSANHGSSIVRETVAGMERISGRVKDSAATIVRLGESSDKIGTIVGTIEDIADQTNLLALNAAIEAARAGEQGRGFAVVADEVRALAERTARATREIGSMIKGVQQETREAVVSMEEGVKEVEVGTHEAAKSLVALDQINTLIDSVSSQIEQIATAADEQSATTGEIAYNIQQITQVIDTTSQGAHESATEANQMAVSAGELRKVVEQFKVTC